MQGPDLKVGKTDIIDSQGNRVVTETTNQNTLDGKSIWTIKQEFDYDNDGKMDAFKKTTQTYDVNSGKLLEETEESNEQSVRLGMKKEPSTARYNRQYLYETATGRLVKVNETQDFDSDGNIDGKGVTHYSYNEEGNLIKVSKHDKTNGTTSDENRTFYDSGRLKSISTESDFRSDGTVDFLHNEEYDKKGRMTRYRHDDHGYSHNSEQTIKYDDNNGTAIIETKQFSSDGKNTLIGHEKRVVKVGKDGKFGKTLSKEDLMPKEEKKEEPAKAEEKQSYEIPSYKPYSLDNGKKRPPKMGV